MRLSEKDPYWRNLSGKIYYKIYEVWEPLLLDRSCLYKQVGLMEQVCPKAEFDLKEKACPMTVTVCDGQ